MFIPLLPSSALAARPRGRRSPLTYDVVGFAALTALLIVLLLFQVLTARAAALPGARRGARGSAPSSSASLQVGVLATLIQTLSLRDKMTARHSAAVARYAQVDRRGDGLRRRPAGPRPHRRPAARHRQVHLPRPHPARRPQADRRRTGRSSRSTRPRARSSSAASTATARSPTSSSPTTSGSTARATRTTCPAEKIPLISRMISVADTFDVMTARDSYRQPVPRSEAIAELRRVSGTQLDGDVVEAFVRAARPQASSPSSTPPTPISRTSSASRPALQDLHAARLHNSAETLVSPERA